MTDVPANAQRLIKRIVAHIGEFTLDGRPLDAKAFTAAVSARMTQFASEDSAIKPTDLPALRAFLTDSLKDVAAPINSAKFKEFLEQAQSGTIPDDVTTFFGAPVAPAKGVVGTVMGWWDQLTSFVGEWWNKGMKNDPFKLVAGNGIALGAAALAWFVADPFVRSIGPDVWGLSTLFTLPITATIAAGVFAMVRGMFPSNEVEATRAAAAVEPPVRSRTRGAALHVEPELQTQAALATEQNRMTVAALAAVVDKPNGITHRNIEGQSDQAVLPPALRGSVAPRLIG